MGRRRRHGAREQETSGWLQGQREEYLDAGAFTDSVCDCDVGFAILLPDVCNSCVWRVYETEYPWTGMKARTGSGLINPAVGTETCPPGIERPMCWANESEGEV